MNLQKIVSDEALETAWGNANFGEQPKRDVIAETILKCASGYHTGKFATDIVTELGLTTKKWELTKKGKEYLWEAFSTQ